MHVEPALTALNLDYHVLFEKPMATSEDDCRKLAEAGFNTIKIFGLCHVLRFTSHYAKMKEIIDTEFIGDIVSIEHLEPVNYWHMAHSYVRGN